jgi:glycosyltransferase involved in cell wall biosynthesis
MRDYEASQCRRFDHVIAVSREDAATIRTDYEIEAVSWIETGVDTEFFRPSGTQRLEPNNLVFTGSMDWLPNQDAICYFVRDILPRVKRRVPDVTLTVVGRDPSPAVAELGRSDPAIRVTGYVEDVRPHIERAAGYIVPLRIGGGTRLKIYEALAMEKPVVSTSLGAEGLPVRDNVELLIADSPESFADAVVRVLRDGAKARALGRRGAATVRARHSWDRVAQAFAAICEEANRRRRKQSALA